MNFSTASKAELIIIATDDEADMKHRYAACRELQFRRKRAVHGHMNQAWCSLHKQIKSDIEKLRHKVLQLRDEMTACGASEREAREYLDRKIFRRINRRILNSSEGRARKHVNRRKL